MRRAPGAIAVLATLAAGVAAAPSGITGWMEPAQRSEFAPPGPYPVRGGITTIAEVNANDPDGLAPLEFTAVTVRGVVQTATGTVDPIDAPANWFWVNDGTGGVAVVRPDAVQLSVAAGDSVEITTAVFTQRFEPLRGTRTLDLAQGGATPLVRIATGRPVLPAVAVSVDSVASSGGTLEGQLVRVAGLTIVDPGAWPVAGASGFVRVTDGTDTLAVFVDEDTDLDGLTPPAGSFALAGFVAQDDPDASAVGPFLAGHFLYPRSLADLSQGDGSGTAVVTPDFVTEGATGVALAFTVTGQTETIETVELEIPASWTWTSPGDVALSGPGFATAAASFAPSGGGWVVTVTGAQVQSSAPGTIAVGSLAAPATVTSSAFPVRTAIASGTPTPILVFPVVEVVSDAMPGDVVVNELYPRTLAQTQGIERSEFVEIRNVSGRDLVIGGWTLSDIGRTPGCTLDSRWAFPSGTTLPDGGFAVVCRTARDVPNNAGFLLDFPSFPGSALLFEMYDSSISTVPQVVDPDDAATPNMVLLDPTPFVRDEIALLGGPNTNVGQCESPNVAGLFVPFAELVVLRDALGAVVDAVEFREPGPCTADLCGAGDPAGTGPADAYPFGPPKVGHTLGRDAASNDTDSSAADLRPSSIPTPGLANIPGDTVPPVLAIPEPNIALSGSILEIRFDEPVVDSLAADPSHYTVSLASRGGGVGVREVLRDPAEPLTRYFLVTEPLPAGALGTLSISGITDLSFDGLPGNAIDTTVTFPVPADAVPICAIQASDEVGFSPLLGDTVTVAGYVTIAPSSADRISIWVQEPGSGGCGVNVFSFEVAHPDFVTYGIRLNDLVRIRGRVTEFISSSSGAGSVTEIAATEGADFLRFLVRGLPGPEPRLVGTGGANDESLEGTLVRTEGTVVNSNSLAAWIDDGTGAVQVFQNFSALDLTRFTVGDRLDVTGVITQFDSTEPYFSGYELVPQSQESIVRVEGAFASKPAVQVGKRVLVPDLGERVDIVVRTPRRSDVIVEIYDAVGRKVATFYDGVGLGEMRFEWDGRGQDGEVVPPGVYLCHVRASALDGGSVMNDTAPIVVGLRLDGAGSPR